MERQTDRPTERTRKSTCILTRRGPIITTYSVHRRERERESIMIHRKVTLFTNTPTFQHLCRLVSNFHCKKNNNGDPTGVK